MNTLNITELWQQQFAKVEEAISLNKKLLKEITMQKASNSLKSIRLIRWIGISFGIFWCLAIAIVVINSWSFTNYFFKTSLIINLLVSFVAIVYYIYHLVLLHNFDNTKTIIEAQQKLVKLKLSNLKILGLLWLQLPVFSMWYMSNQWMNNSPATFWFIQVPVVIIQLFLGIWIFRNLNYKNCDKKWFKWLVTKGEFANIQQAISLLEQVDESVIK